MSSQMFKSTINNCVIFKLLQDLCIKINETSFLFNNDSYKKGMFNQSIPQFIETCRPFYHKSKQYYLNRKINYNNIITILRQLCKNNNISYVSKMVYDKSKYNICYIFDLPLNIEE